MRRSLLLVALLTARAAEAAVVHQPVVGPGLEAWAKEPLKLIEVAAASHAGQAATHALPWQALMPSPLRRLVSGLSSRVSEPLLPGEGPGGPHIVVDNGVEDQRPGHLTAFIVLGFFMIWGGILYLIAQYYVDNVKVKASPLRADSAKEKLNEFKYGLFECFGDGRTCIWSCCCPCIRWGDNVSTVGILRSFWLAGLIWYGLTMLNSQAQTKGSNGDESSFQDPTAWVIFALIAAGFRHELRLKFHMATSATTFVTDCLLYGCCTCCAIIQDARQVDEAARTGHPAVVKQDDEPAV